MVSIVTIYRENKKIFEEYWLPLIYKHNAVEFIVVDNNSEFNKLSSISHQTRNLKTFYIKEIPTKDARKFGASKASKQCIYLSSIRAVPAYDTMILLEEIKEHQMLIPEWINYDRKNIKEMSNNKNSFSCSKRKLLESSEDSYMDTHNPEILRKGSLYYV